VGRRPPCISRRRCLTLSQSQQLPLFLPYFRSW
jgi:hypothetical protein